MKISKEIDFRKFQFCDTKTLLNFDKCFLSFPKKQKLRTEICFATINILFSIRTSKV